VLTLSLTPDFKIQVRISGARSSERIGLVRFRVTTTEAPLPSERTAAL
jgi:hypothetical protein